MFSKWLVPSLTLLVLVGFTCPGALAEQDADKPEAAQSTTDDQVLAGPNAEPSRPTDSARDRRRDERGSFSGHRRGGRGPGQIEKDLQKLNLSDEQKSKVSKILKTHRAEFQKWRQANRDKLKPLHQQIRTAREANDQEQIKKTHEQIQALRKTGPQKIHKQILGVLNDQQKKQLKQARREGRKGEKSAKACNKDGRKGKKARGQRRGRDPENPRSRRNPRGRGGRPEGAPGRPPVEGDQLDL